MSNRPYTAILTCGKIVKIEDVFASLIKTDAKREIEEAYSGFALVALIAGTHKSHSFVYDQSPEQPVKHGVVDVFDMTYLEEPTV